eukprot:c24046_g1_i1 orf=247-924(-)
MLTVFSKSVANGPQELVSPSNGKRSCDLVAKFLDIYEHGVCMKLDDTTSMAYTHERQALLRPRVFASLDSMFCVFKGNLENLARLRQQYGLSKPVNEVLLVIEAYRTLRDRAPIPASQVVADFGGQFAFILFDNQTRTIFVAVDSEGEVPLFWGTTSDGWLAFSDDEEIIVDGCGKLSLAPFPQGCYFTSKGGLRSFKYPLKEVKAVKRVDKDGEPCGVIFKVDD